MTDAALPTDLASRLSTSALAFRGYNVENLSRTKELLAVSAYRPAVESRLFEAGEVCRRILGRPVDLIRRVQEDVEPELDEYAEAVAIIFSIELAQVDLLRECHGVDVADAALSFGFSLGELAAIVVAGVVDSRETLSVPLTFAAECAELAHDVTMGVVFSRGRALKESTVRALCEDVSAEGRGTIGISAVLSPNTLLVLGQGDTLDRFSSRLPGRFSFSTHVRRNDSKWPPLHTPIVRQRNVCDRAAVMIEGMHTLRDEPVHDVVSLVTGRRAYRSGDTRTVLRDWTDHPQRLWDGVCGVLESDVRTVMHFGPGPNLIPATFRRLADNVLQQTGEWSISGIGLRAVQQLAHRSWLASLLPRQTSLLRAPKLRHVIIEDWLLANAPS